ncbi:MAG: bifunctional phosphopantothenoylcysteine decarboxylase/phosphopantothenate--cysteine ligase CoaBC [Rickettsiales bacterium]|nr:bifunctional phosphopantothenoylcysteine decarboxylase/phosphopantothenate--cysteine ligase CoaBC [Rickettsiales bacterium]
MSKKILLIITGSVAAYKAVDLVRLLQKKSHEVSVILTKAAQEFVTPLLVSSIAKNKIYTELFSSDDVDGMTHIKLSRDNDLILVAPASADFIAKMANGYADDLASTVLLAANKKIIIAPAMNEKMWENDATKRNLQNLVESGVSIIEPLSDILACGENGIGKMQEPAQIVDEVEDFFANQNKLAGKKIILTGGGTREYIDPVRFIGNDSSGKQALELAKVLSEMGADVEFIAANIFMKIPLPKDKITHVKTADEMFASVKNKIAQSDVFIGCAAVSDYKVKNVSAQKIKKNTTKNLVLELVENIDILDFVGHASNRPALVIGFAAESENLIKNAQEKLQKKNCDLIIANDIENGVIFGAVITTAYLVEKKSIQDLGKISKNKLAKIIAKKIASY